MKRKKSIVLLLLLLLLFAVFICLLLCQKKGQQPAFTLQGETRIPYGDIELKIWDNNTEDGDTVAVYLNGKLIKDSLPILYEPYRLAIGKIGKGIHVLGVKAINEGFNSPASASMSVSNGKERIEFEMDSWIDSAASWNIIIE